MIFNPLELQNEYVVNFWEKKSPKYAYKFLYEKKNSHEIRSYLMKHKILLYILIQNDHGYAVIEMVISIQTYDGI